MAGPVKLEETDSATGRIAGEYTFGVGVSTVGKVAITRSWRSYADRCLAFEEMMGVLNIKADRSFSLVISSVSLSLSMTK